MSKIVPLIEAPQTFAAAVVIDVDEATPLEKLIDRIRAHSGPSRVYLNVSTHEGLRVQVETHASIRVTYSPRFVAEISAILPRESFCALGPTRKVIPLTNGLSALAAS